ncbi:transposable element Tc3 transposase [Trichonephila clavipes]|nr:transposable element Tc3 transposase [Trichonephila clavipes]
MIWAGIVIDGRTDLHFFDTGSVTAQRYRDEAFEPYARLFRGAVGPDFIFMDDSAPCHRAVLIDDFLETENIQRMSWPANSLDLNPIEHVWDILGTQIAALSHPPSFVTELKRALQETWNRLSPQLIHHLIATGGTLSSCRSVSPLMRLVEGEERWKAPEHPQGVLPQNWGKIEQNRTVTCMELKDKANDRRKYLALRRYEFH